MNPLYPKNPILKHHRQKSRKITEKLIKNTQIPPNLIPPTLCLKEQKSKHYCILHNFFINLVLQNQSWTPNLSSSLHSKSSTNKRNESYLSNPEQQLNTLTIQKRKTFPNLQETQERSTSLLFCSAFVQK